MVPDRSLDAYAKAVQRRIVMNDLINRQAAIDADDDMVEPQESEEA